jgi:hypothetical protein
MILSGEVFTAAVMNSTAIWISKQYTRRESDTLEDITAPILSIE